jgi:predicted RecB family nuclease
VSGDLLEAKTRSAELGDVEPDDFIRFLEYAYRGGYTVPSWELDLSAHVTSKVEEAPADTDPSPPQDDGQPIDVEIASIPVTEQWNLPSSVPHTVRSKKKAKAAREKSLLRSMFQKRQYNSAYYPFVELTEGFRPKSNSSPDQNFRPVLLAHARLYTFAEMRLVGPLKSLALNKIHKTLMGFSLYDQRIGDIVAVTRYAYENGSDRAGNGTLNELRQMLVEYMACEVDTIGKHKDFRALLEEGGEFVTDFWALVTNFLL